MRWTDTSRPTSSPAREHGLRAALRERRAVSAVGLVWPHAGLAEAFCLLGFDCVIVDAEHSGFTEQLLEDVVRACHLHGAYTVLRTADTGPALSRYFDVGIDGVSAPMIATVDDARAVRDAVKYPPAGRRGIGAGRATDWGLFAPSWTEVVETSNAGSVIMIQIEDEAGVHQLPEILDQVPEIDVVIVGAVDLSQSMGLVGQLSHARVRDAVDRTVTATRAAGRAAGLSVTAATVGDVVASGATYLVASSPAIVQAGSAPLVAAVAAHHPAGASR